MGGELGGAAHTRARAGGGGGIPAKEVMTAGSGVTLAAGPVGRRGTVDAMCVSRPHRWVRRAQPVGSRERGRGGSERGKKTKKQTEDQAGDGGRDGAGAQGGTGEAGGGRAARPVPAGGREAAKVGDGGRGQGRESPPANAAGRWAFKNQWGGAGGLAWRGWGGWWGDAGWGALGGRSPPVGGLCPSADDLR